MWLGTMSRSAPGTVVIIAAKLHAQFFGDRNLHVIHVAAVPHRLENSIRESEGENVLNRFFAEVMVDAVNLVFVKHFANFAV